MVEMKWVICHVLLSNIERQRSDRISRLCCVKHVRRHSFFLNPRPSILQYQIDRLEKKKGNSKVLETFFEKLGTPLVENGKTNRETPERWKDPRCCVLPGVVGQWVRKKMDHRAPLQRVC